MADLFVHAEQGPYFTLAAAYAAASVGDRILLSPGTWVGVTFTKAVHILGVTANPITDTVNIVSNASYPNNALKYSLAVAPEAPVLIQNITIYSPFVASWSYTNFSAAGSAAGTTFIFNKCLFAYSGSGQNYIYSGPSGITLKFLNCRIPGNYYGTEFGTSEGTTMELSKCRLTSALNFDGTPPALPILDYVTTDADGYGPGYGTVYGTPAELLRVYGQIVLPRGVDRSQAAVWLFQESPTGQVRMDYHSSTQPNSVTGMWQFLYVPPTIRFWALIIPPAGYAPNFEGPTVGVPMES